MRWFITVKAAQQSPATPASTTPSGSSALPISGVSSTIPRTARAIARRLGPGDETDGIEIGL